MKSKIRFGILAMCIMSLTTSCLPRGMPTEKEVVTVTKTISEFKRDTIVKIEADSSFYESLIECQNGKPVLIHSQGVTNKSLLVSSGANLQVPNVILNDSGKLKISCQYLANQLKITLKERRILEQRLSEKTIQKPPEYIEKDLSWFQKLWLFLGKFFSAVFLIYLITKIPWKAFLKL